MATLSVSMANTAVVTGTKNYTISDADLQNLLNWAQKKFFTSAQTPTNQQILLTWVQWWIDMSIAGVKDYQISVASDAAVANVIASTNSIVIT